MTHAHEQGSNDLAQLAAQSAWARRLAIALARDVHAGEDLAQEALLATVRGRPQGDLRGWLARVIRNLARLRRRTDGERGARERAAAREDLSDDPALVLQRIELQEALLGAVRALPEPYRNTILLRWFEELEPEEIARRTDTPVRTVHTRLHRALGLLREDLDRRSRGDRSRWLAAWLPLVPLPHSPLPWALAMQAKTKLVIAAVAFAAVASLWIALRPLNRTESVSGSSPADARLALETEHGSTLSMKSTGGANERAPVGTAAPGAGVAAAHATGLTLRSSVGLELPFLEWQTPLGDWMRRDLKEGRCETADMTLPCRVRAPGHVPVEAKDGDELVLEPDELLILEGHDLRSYTSSIRFEDPYHKLGEPMTLGLERAACSGYLSAGQWAMAVSHDLVHEALFDGVASAIIIWRDQHRADVHLQSVAGTRGRWTIPCEGRPACAPLTLQVQRPSGETTGRVVLKVVQPHEGTSDGQRLLFDWGSVDIQPKENLWADDAHVEPSTDEYTYVALPRDQKLLVYARDETSGAYGRLVFDHDGSARRIVLRPAFELLARLVSATDSSPITSARLWWEFPDGKEQVYGWHCSSGAISKAEDGVYRRFLPLEPLLREEEPLEVPPSIHVHVDAPGFEDLDARYETAGAQHLDCGELRLKPKAAQLVLAPGHGVDPKSVEWGSLRISAMPEIEWGVRSATLGTDGSLNIHLDASEDSTPDHPQYRAQSFEAPNLTQAPWSSDSSRWLVLNVMNEKADGPWLFERQSDGRFAPVPRSEREIVFQCDALPPLDESHVTWVTGWMWHDQWGIISGSSWNVGEVERTRVTFPSGGASIYWSAKGPPPGVLGAPKEIGGSIPVEEINGKIVLK